MSEYLLIYTTGDCFECGGMSYEFFTSLELMTAFINASKAAYKNFDYHYACKVDSKIEYKKQKIESFIPVIKQL